MAEIDEALFEVAQLLADLTRVDGTVLITDSLEVLGFGAEIAGDLPEALASCARATWTATTANGCAPIV